MIHSLRFNEHLAVDVSVSFASGITLLTHCSFLHLSYEEIYVVRGLLFLHVLRRPDLDFYPLWLSHLPFMSLDLATALKTSLFFYILADRILLFRELLLRINVFTCYFLAWLSESNQSTQFLSHRFICSHSQLSIPNIGNIFIPIST